jgi:hypothetical protein
MMVAGCGTSTQVPGSVAATASNPTATAAAPSNRDNCESARYCQPLESGAWVTNMLHSTTPCACQTHRTRSLGVVAGASRLGHRCLHLKLGWRPDPLQRRHRPRGAADSRRPRRPPLSPDDARLETAAGGCDDGAQKR